jgi:hypothetical protein
MNETTVLSHTYLMAGLSVLHLRFYCRAIDPLAFGDQPGSALRGALYGVLQRNFCSQVLGFTGPDHAATCPVCWLLALEDQRAGRGKDLPRPLVIQPPLLHRHVPPGEPFAFGIGLVGQAQELLPFILHAVQTMGQIGVGRGRGRFQLVDLREYSPLLDAERELVQGKVVRRATLQVTAPRIDETATHWNTDQVTLHCLTPLRLTAAGQLVKFPEPRAFVQRLLERCQALAEQYSAPTGTASQRDATRQEWRLVYATLSDLAERITIIRNDTRWVEVESGSRRLGRTTPIGGLVGRAVWQGELQPLLPWLLWGQSLHVGKDAVKGNGWVQVQPPA